MNWHTLGVAALCAVALWPPASPGQTGYYTGYFEAQGETRELAEHEAVFSTARLALRDMIGPEPRELRECLESWVAELAADDYRFLVSRPIYDIDMQIGGEWALEGSMRIDNLVLNDWYEQESSSCGNAFRQRRVVYVEPVYSADPALAEDLDRATRHVEQVFGESGYQIVDESRRQAAQFRMLLNGVDTGARGAAMTMSVTGLYVDNRVDDQPHVVFNVSVNERLRTTEEELEDALFRRQAQAILTQVRGFEEDQRVASTDIEIVFVSARRDFDALQVASEEVLAAVAERFDLPAEYLDRTDVLDPTEFDDRAEISVFVPAEYGATLNRSRMRELRDVAESVLDYDVAASRFSNNDTRLTISNADGMAEAWEREFWRYLEAGQLTLPEDQSALGVVNAKLRAEPGDETALEFIDEIVARLVRQAIEKIRQGAYGSANADLTLAESIGAGRPTRPWESPREQLQILAGTGPGTRPGTGPGTGPATGPGSGTAPGPGPGRPSAAEPPLVIFPDLEATRGFTVRARAGGSGIAGLAADVDGIERVELNGRRIPFAPASTVPTPLEIPGSTTYEFALPGDGTDDLRVTVIDGDGERTERTLVNRSGSYVAEKAAAPGAASLAAVLEEGEASLEGNYHALIIANQDYERVMDLATPIRDADGLESVLIEHFNFAPERVYRVNDGTAQDIREAIDALDDAVGPNDSLLIYYAGHGYRDNGLGGSGYWIPVDGKNYDEDGRRASWISNAFVSEYVEKVKARHVLLISDSCFAGTFAQRGNEAGYFVATLDYIKQKAGKDSRRAITSGDIQPVFDTGGAGGHSVFAGQMLKVMREYPGEFLTAEQLYKSVAGPVRDAVPQSPQYFVMSDNDTGGDFVFVGADR